MIFPSSNERSIFIAIISFLVGMSIGLLPSLDIQSVKTIFLTAVTTFAGAFFAFQLNEKREKRDIYKKKLAEVNKLMFTLVRMFNFFASFHKQFIEPELESPFSFISIRPSIGGSDANFDLDFDSILFLVPEKEVGILTELSELDELFRTAKEVIAQRTHIHANIIQPKMEAAGFHMGTPTTLKDINDILGDQTVHTMKELTSGLVNLIDSGSKDTESIIGRLHKIFRDMFPKENLIHMARA